VDLSALEVSDLDLESADLSQTEFNFQGPVELYVTGVPYKGAEYPTVLSYDGVERHNLARVNADGSLDTPFGAGITAGIDDTEIVDSLGIQPDGRFLIGGMFHLNLCLPNIVARAWGD